MVASVEAVHDDRLKKTSLVAAKIDDTSGCAAVHCFLLPLNMQN